MAGIVLVTGTSGGLGLAIAVKAARAGYSVFASMRDTARAGPLQEALSGSGATARILPLDVQDQASVEAAVATVIAEAGRIDILVNNAGAGYVRSVEQASDAEIDAALDVNLRGVIRCTRAVIPHMRRARSGRVVTVSSIGGLVGQPFNEVYCAAKFGVEGFMESLATYVGPAFGLHFTLVEPGGIQSDFAAAVRRKVAATGGMIADAYLPILQAYLGGIQARAGEGGVFQSADEVADVILGTFAMDNPPVRLRTSAWAEEFTALKTAADPDGTRLRDAVIERYLGTLARP